MRARTALLLATAVPLTVTAAAVALKAGAWKLTLGRHAIWLTPRPRPNCLSCRGEGGWWGDGPNPEMEACGCWANRPELRVRILPVPAWPDEPPF
ncbi:hypothetical protein [Streptomyces sp. NPDC003688]